MFDVDRAVEQRQEPAQPDGWEPATFVCRCPRGHEWRSHGTYHARSCAIRPDRATCPRGGCGLRDYLVEICTGPARSQGAA